MDEALVVETLHEQDSAACVELWHEAGLTRPWNDPQADFARAINGPSSTMLGIRAEGTLVASVMVGHDGHRGWLYYVAVTASKRRRGLATKLIDASTTWLRERGIPKMQLMVRSDNTDVLHFYDYLGFSDDEVVVRSKVIEPTSRD